MNKNRNGLIGVIITTILLIILVFISNLKFRSFSYLNNFVESIIMPIQTGISYIGNKLSSNDKYFATMDYLREENEKLTKQNKELEEDLRKLEIIQAENNTLKDYLALKEQYKDYSTIPAYVLAKDISNYSEIFTINVGTNEGIKENMTVISSEGLVGHIISVTEKAAKVQTLLDTSNVVSAYLENSKDNIICRGTLSNNELKATYIDTNTVLIEGEKVYSSGMGGIYPKGIFIGTVKKINKVKNITDKNCIIESAVDFKNLETVLVISN